MKDAAAPIPHALLADEVLGGDYYFLREAPPDSPGITVVCGGCETCGAGYRVARESFPYQAVEFVRAGSGSLVLGGQTHALQPGTVFAYGPGSPHSITASPGETMEKYFIDLAGRRAAALLEAGPCADGRPVQVADAEALATVFVQLQASGKQVRANTAAICALLAEVLLLRIEELALPHQAADSGSWQTYQRCRCFLEEHFLELDGLGPVAAACRVGEPYICRVFRRYHGISPYQYLLQRKMGHAALLLLNRRLLVKEVAQRVGFADPYHFSKAFKRVHGVAPQTFRRRGRRGSDEA